MLDVSGMISRENKVLEFSKFAWQKFKKDRLENKAFLPPDTHTLDNLKTEKENATHFSTPTQIPEPTLLPGLWWWSCFPFTGSRAV